MKRWAFRTATVFSLAAALLGAGSFASPASPALAAEASGAPAAMTGQLTLEQGKGPVRSNVSFRAEGLEPGQPAELIWSTVEGGYKLDGIYSFIGQVYEERELILLRGTADETGRWDGAFQVPEGFGGDHTVYVRQNGGRMAQNVYFVSPTFTVSPESGPVGTEITIEAEGIGWSGMESNWQLTYDNKLTGLISAVSTNGKAVAKIRAAGPVGSHTLTVWHGYLGLPYLNHQQAPTSYLPVPTFTFQVTEGEPDRTNAVEPVPASAAGGGVFIPAPQNKPGVKVTASRAAGTVGEPVELSASGFPAGGEAKLVWNTMSGSRVTAAGFAEKQVPLGEAVADDEGKLVYDFAIPEDLGSVPHRIDLMIGDELYGQTYVSINPSIVGMTPVSGPAGTEVTIELQGVGWTEFDNAYYLTYDNAYVGYMCGFNSQGTVKFTIVASGEPGYHLIDLYPGIYRGEQRTPDLYLAPQLTYGDDHPGTAIPAIRMGFEITGDK